MIEDFTQSEEMKQLFASEANEYLQLLEHSLVILEGKPENVNLLNDIFRVAHTLKSMAGTMGYEKITALSHEMENLLHILRKKKIKVTSKMIDLFLKCSDTLKLLKDEAISGEDKKVNTEPIINELKEILAEIQGIEPEQKEKFIIKGKEAEEEEEEVPVSTTMMKTTSVRISIKQLDILMDLVGELVINKARLVDIAEKHRITELDVALKQFDRISLDLQEEVLKTRLVPISHIFDRYPRMMRDMAKKSRKEVSFVIEGADIEVDRILLEEVNPPLVHLLRNAIDHGIEGKQERKKTGKSSKGSIRLIGRREKDYVKIIVIDDGNGISPDEIREVAVNRNFITSEQAAKLSDKEAIMLICEPGFSTAKEVTDTSGRGVGMDAVKALVEKFNGKLDIYSRKGKGTTITIQVPLSLAIVNALLVKVGGDIYAVPLKNISETVRVQKDSIKRIASEDVIVVREEIIPLFYLGELYHGKRHVEDEIYAVLVDAVGKRMGLVVDSLVGQREIVIKTLTGFMKSAKGFSGATILGDGRVILIIDIDAMAISMR